MKPLTQATQKLFTPLIQSIPSYLHEQFKRDRLELISTRTDDGEILTTMELYSVSEDSSDKNKYMPLTHAVIRFPERLFEKHYVRGNKWRVPLTDSNVELIWDTWPKKQIKGNKLARELITNVLATTTRQQWNAEAIAEYRVNGTVPKKDETALEKPDAELIKFQKVARYCGVRSNSFALFFEQGCGKTPTATSIAVNDYARGVTTSHTSDKKDLPSIYRCLIICPKTLKFNWEEEIAHFCPVKYRTTVIEGTKVEREMQIAQAILSKNGESHISFVIASYGALRNTENGFCLKSLVGMPLPENLKWDMVILDEAHALKSASAKQTKAAHSLREASKRRLALTGTPFVNSLFDLWGIWEYLDRYQSGFSNFHAFREFHSKYDANGKRDLSSFENVPLLQERLARTSFLITKKEALPELPEKTYEVRTVSMSPEQTKVYNDLATQMYAQIENELDSSENRQLTINNALTKLLRLAQITAGFVVWDASYSNDGEELEPAQLDRFDPNNKLELLVEILKEKLEYSEYEKTLVWCNWVPAIKFISARLTLEGINNVMFYGKTKEDDRKTLVDRFNQDSKCKVMVGNPKAGGVGLNLLGYDYQGVSLDEMSRLTNCTTCIYYAQDWSLTARSQSEARPHRKGTRKAVHYIDLCVEHSIDMEIRKRVMGKIQTALKLQDVKEILRKIANPVKVSRED